MRDQLYGEGFGYPFNWNSDGGAEGAAAVRSVVASIIRLLDTAPGEDQFNPQFGCGLKFLVFENDTETLRALAASVIASAVEEWEPRVQEILGITVDRVADLSPNTLNIRVYFRLIQDQEIRNFVYPFSVPTI